MTPPIMGITHARVVLYSIDMARMEVCDLIVDTGSTLSWVPEEVAARVGIRATELRTFRLADGREVDRPVGEAILECEGLRGATRIVFARPGDGPAPGPFAGSSELSPRFCAPRTIAVEREVAPEWSHRLEAAVITSTTV